MNDELLELEAELKRLRPLTPSELCEARVEAALARSETAAPAASPWRRAWRGLALTGVAAALALVAALPRGTAIHAALPAVAVDNEVREARDEGVVTLDDGTTAWRTRIQYLDTVRWSDGGRTLTLVAPREELRLVPLVAY